MIVIFAPAGRAAKSVISNDFSDRIDACVHRFSYLNDHLGRTLGLRVWITMNRLLDESLRIGMLSVAWLIQDR
jgi:hypothetical protein